MLRALVAQDGVPRAITVDNGPEFISCALDRWAHRHGVELHFIQTGKPTQNAYAESFNGKFRDEFLSKGRWPHSALGYATPAARGGRWAEAS